MFKRFLAFFCSSTEAYQAERQVDFLNAFNAGYNWAAGALLRQECTVSDIEDRCSTASWPTDSAQVKEFDRGALGATARLVALGFVPDDSLDSSVGVGPDEQLEDCK